jgi:hypothetical protein
VAPKNPKKIPKYFKFHLSPPYKYSSWLDYFIKFVIHELNSKMVKSGMVVLTERRKTNVADVDMTVC